MNTLAADAIHIARSQIKNAVHQLEAADEHRRNVLKSIESILQRLENDIRGNPAPKSGRLFHDSTYK